MAGTVGTLLVLPRLHALYQGVFAAGARFYAFEAGTTTPLATYNSQDLSSANAQGFAADQYGLFGPIYLLDRAYKIRITTAAGETIYEQDNVRPYSVPALNRVDPSICDGRLTLTSGVPVTTADVLAATSVYFTPFKGNKIALYDATYGFDLYSFSELSIALGTDAASLPYDLFAYINAGAVAIERLAWTNGSTRATALTTQDGVLVKSGDPTRRYLGTYRTTSTIGQTEDSASKRYVWNYYNRVPRRLARLETTNTWTYTTATWRQANASTDNRVSVVIGWLGALVSLQLNALFSNTGADVDVAVAIGEDSTTTPTSGQLIGSGWSQVANLKQAARGTFSKYPAVGAHDYNWLEYSVNSGVTTWLGDNGGTLQQSGILGTVDG